MQRSSFHFTFRQLRSFRFFYLTQEFVNKNLLTNSFEVQSKLESSQSTYQINYSIFGNAEAISPVQRRRFRESQRTSTFSQKRKLSLFPTKRGKRIYSFSAIKPIQSFFDGTRRCVGISEKLDTSPAHQIFSSNINDLSFSLESHGSLKKAMSQTVAMQSIFQFSPFYFFGNIVYTKKNSIQISSMIFSSFLF